MANKIILPEDIRSIQINDCYFPVVDGVVQTVHNYALHMNRTSYAAVACPAEKGSFNDSTLEYDVVRAPSITLPVMGYGLALPINKNVVSKMESLRPDIIHIHSPFLMRGMAFETAKDLGIPIISSFHSKYYDDFYGATKSRALSRLATNWILEFYNACDEVWACSETTAETLHSYGYKKKIFVMPNGTDFKLPHDTERLRSAVINKFGLTGDRKTLLFVGNLFWKKNIKLIIDVFKEICLETPDKYRLVMVGSGDNERAIKAYAERLHFTKDQLIFTGKISNRDLMKGIYLAADLFFFPSVYDNAPIVLREAAAAGTPALLAAGSNSAEAVTDGVNGFIAKNDLNAMLRKIEEIFSDEEKLLIVGANAKKTIPVPWENIIPRVYEEYAAVIERKQKNA